jgi:hypothetical protein
MATRIAFVNGTDTTVEATEDEVVAAVRRDHPNPVKIEGSDGLLVYVNWSTVTHFEPSTEPRVPV